jgi:3-dehydroquinate synthase
LHEIFLELGSRSYPIYIETGLFDQLSIHLPKEGEIALVTNPIINDLYGHKIGEIIGNYNKVIVPDGEEAKDWKELEKLLGRLLDFGLDRKSTIIAFGGGSIGDLAGFTASIYMRGIKLIQIPTTLLAMVDSSIGGKTAINHPKGKNLVGRFHQPEKVIIDPSFLSTLPERELRSGMAEVIKYGIISDSVLFRLLEEKKLRDFTLKDKEEIIVRCVAIKTRFVENDEEDNKGIRAALNLGHTLGHAVEILSDHEINHGEAVSMGIVAASWISKEDGYISESNYNKIITLIESYGLPTHLPNLDKKNIIKVMHRDKKAEAGQIRFVLPTGIGKTPLLKYVSTGQLTRMIKELQK